MNDPTAAQKAAPATPRTRLSADEKRAHNQRYLIEEVFYG